MSHGCFAHAHFGGLVHVSFENKQHLRTTGVRVIMAKKFFNADLERLQLKQAFVDWIVRNYKNQLNIFITGKSGVGKSRLVNGLVGERVAVEGRRKEACTATVTPYPAVEIDNIKVIVWDSPGLQDETCDEEKYLDNLKTIWTGIDVVIYCLRMDETRFYSEDQKAIRKLTEAFGMELWKKAVIALTFANKVEDHNGGDEVRYFKDELAEWKQKIHTILTKLHIDSKVLNSLAIVPAGNYTKLRLPTSDNWIADLWSECYEAMNLSASLAWYLINKHRLKFAGSEGLAAATVSSQRGPTKSKTTQTTGESCGEENIPQIIPLNPEQETSFWKKLWNGFCSAVGSAVTCTISAFITLFTGNVSR